MIVVLEIISITIPNIWYLSVIAKGDKCSRSDKFSYNVELVSSM